MPFIELYLLAFYYHIALIPLMMFVIGATVSLEGLIDRRHDKAIRSALVPNP